MMQNKFSASIFSSRHKPWSVSKLNVSIKQMLGSMPGLWVQGEISNLTKASSGHIYFSLKDNNSQVSCAWFRQNINGSKVKLENGMDVCVLARPTLYEPRGSYQLVVSQCNMVGDGALLQAFNELKAKLNKEGLFDQSKKKKLPKLPDTIGVVTSPTGAALQDIISVLKRRYPLAQLIVYPAVVQGIAAPQSILNALNQAINHNIADVLILARGGGAYEDLCGFNDENLARAIVSCPIPTISGVGHEIDFTIADFAADVRGATPSAAAEAATLNINDIVNYLSKLKQDLVLQMQQKIAIEKHKIKLLSSRCTHPKHKIATQKQSVDFLEQQLNKSVTNFMYTLLQKITILEKQLQRVQPNTEGYKSQLEFNQQKLMIHIKKQIESAQHSVRSMGVHLNTLSPLNVLSRGYSIVTANNVNISNCCDLKVGQGVEILFKSGKAWAKITKVE